MEFKHSSGKDGPNLKNRLKAMIEQTHFFSNSTHTQKTRLQAAKSSNGSPTEAAFTSWVLAKPKSRYFRLCAVEPFCSAGKQTFASLGLNPLIPADDYADFLMVLGQRAFNR